MRICFIILMLLRVEFFVNSSDLEPKVVHGIRAENIEKFGYSVYFVSVSEEQSACGGSIINQRTILTAAHCIHDAPLHRGFFIRVGSDRKAKGVPYKVKNTVVHERYDPTQVVYDIGLAVIDRDIKLSSRVYRVALSPTPARAGLVGVIAGWGAVEKGVTQGAEQLLYTKQKILPLSKCREIMKVQMRPKTFCAGEKHAKSYPWRGDSGGALVLDGNVQIGVLSAQAAAGVAVYTDVSQFLTWIDTQSKRLYCQ